MEQKQQTAVEWLIEELKEYDVSSEDDTYLITIPSWVLTEKEEKAKEMENMEKLKKQLFIEKVYEIIGIDKTIELLQECKKTFK